MAIKKDIITSVLGILVLTLLCGVLYPLVITGVSQVAFPGNANGQQVHVAGKLVGSKLIGQSFGDVVINAKTGKPKLDSAGNPVTTPALKYFQTRPSGTAPADNAAGTAFANYGPNGTVTEQAIAANIKAYIVLNGRYYPGGLTPAKIPVDAADTSGSGVDPDISVANADIQAHRIAAVRQVPLTQVDRLVSTYTGGRGLGFSGEPTVNVLELNLALNRLGGR
ncbi:MAG TPA: potassium-transporting ATPase subunit C [Solirubrobacteraceae bacterium]|jgi:K+-transporting ATPase ATPase C chain|nr:potassium-transporting ATPase subunit C [Solirubrobacteraceae bacterium]